ncbi:MAG: glycosyltransferase [Clostridia bacterium]|nr:glycosyltransferase [Clostridia bacterium]
MKNVLFITESYSVAPSPNGACVKNIVDEMIREGFNVSVLTLKNQYAKESFSNIDGVKVYRVKTYPEYNIYYSKTPKLLKSIFIRLLKALKIILIPFHPITSPATLKRLYKKGKEVVIKDSIDTIVSVYRDAETAIAGVKLKRKFKDKKLVVYTLDAVSGGVCSNKLVPMKKHVKKCRKLEEKFIKECDVYVPMQSHIGVYENRFSNYEGKIKYHDIPNLIFDGVDYAKESDVSLNFTFTGMMSETNADCSFFLKVFKEILKVKDATFNVYGGITESLLGEIKKTGLFDKNVFYHGRVDKNELISVRKNADVLLTFGNNHPCGIPCKIFEYISALKPILAFYKIDDDAGKAYLEKYQKAIVLKENDAMVEEYAGKIIEKLSDFSKISIDRDLVKETFYENTPRQFIETLKSI